MKVTKLIRVFVVFVILFLITGCSLVSGLTASKTTGQINGSISQVTSNVDSGATIRLMPEKYYTMTLEPSATIEPSEYIEVKVENSEKFVIENIEPGNYYLNVEVTYNPCFLGAPGTIFNGAIIVIMDTWTPIGFSFTDGTSFISGRTEVFEVKAGRPLEITLETPRCY